MPLPQVVDHRPQQTPVRDQQHRGTCVAFAACAELEAILMSETKSSYDLCENLAYYWFMKEEQAEPCKDPGLATFKAAGYLQKHLVGDEADWPYVGKDPIDLTAEGHCDKINNAPKIFHGKAGVGIDKFRLLPGASEVKPDRSIDIRDTTTLERLLDEGQNIVFGTIFAWSNSAAKDVIDVKLGPSGQPIFGAGGHAMLIVGYRRLGIGQNDRRPIFIVKNSWGADYGHDGYLYLTYDYIRTYARYGYTTTKVLRGKIDLNK
jgi:C1A family cysteine protease